MVCKRALLQQLLNWIQYFVVHEKIVVKKIGKRILLDVGKT